MLRLCGVLAGFASACKLNFAERADVGDAGDANDGARDDGQRDHDEDGDGIADVIDFCPHIANPQNGDGDGDLVGDVCDPQPGVAADSWVLFAPMTGDVPELERGPEWTLRDDDWELVDSINPAQLIRTGKYASVDAWVGFDVTSVGTGGVQAAIVLRNSGGTTPYNYGEVFDGGSGARISIIEFDGTSYNVQSTSPLGGAFPTGAMTLHLAARPADNFTFDNGTLTSAALTPGYVDAQFLLFGFGNLSGRVRYVAVVQSQ